MKAHIGVDSKQGHVHSVCSTAASVADKHMLPDLLHGAERKVWGDGAYQGQMLSATDGAQTRVHRHFFKTLGIPLQATGNVVISQSMARMLWPIEDPIGKRVKIEMKRENTPSTVIVVVGDIKHSGLAAAVHPTAYWSYPDLGFQFMTLVIRTEGDPRALAPDLRQTVLRLDKNQPIADVVPMETTLSMSIARLWFATQATATFASIAFLLAIMGIYGIISHDVGQRRREIGIRIALGAQRRSVLRLMLSRGMTLAGLAIVIGVVASFALTRLLTSVLHETRPNDPAILILSGSGLGIVALSAGDFAVRRISSVEPMDVLRRE